MIKLIILLIIIVILLYILPKINKRCNSKKKKNNKKNKVRESFEEQPLKTEHNFLESVEGTMCDPESEQINTIIMGGNGMVVQNITNKQLECVPICSLDNSNITLERGNCIQCGNSTEDPGTITQRANKRCVDYSEDGMSYFVLQRGDELMSKPNCRYGVDFENCPACEVLEDVRFNGPNKSCQNTVTVHPPVGKELCTMNWKTYGEESTDTNIKNYVNDRTINIINSYTEKLDSPHTFKVPSDKCDRDCVLSSFWAEVPCPTDCGQTGSSKEYKKKILQDSLNDGANCLDVAQGETNNNDATYSVITTAEGSFVIKSVQGGCEATLPCCEVGNDNHYNNWTFVGETPVDWNGTDDPETCSTTYKRHRRFDNTKCINGNSVNYIQTQVKTSKRCCSSTNPNDYTTVYDYNFYDSQGNEIIEEANTDQTSKMDLNKNTVPCKTMVREVKRYPFKEDVCSNSDGASPRNSLTVFFRNNDECPQDCVVEPEEEEFSECPVCKNKATDRPRKYRKWKVKQEKEGNGKTCIDSFNDSNKKALGEIPPDGIARRLNRTFSTYVDCTTNVGVCCNPDEPTHWQSSDTYTKYAVIYDNDGRNSGFEVSENGTPSSASEFDNYQNLCNTKVVKTSTFSKTNRCILNENDTVESLKPSPLPEERLSLTTRCPIDCELSVSEFSECSGTCGPGRKRREWRVTRTPRYGGQTCSNLFHNEDDLRDKYNIELEPGEHVIGSGIKNIGNFTSEVNCENDLPCCNLTVEGHFNSNVSGYISFTPWNNTTDYKIYSDDNTENNWVGSSQEGENKFNIWGEVPCNTTIKKRYSFTRNEEVCTDGEEPFNAILHQKTNDAICPIDCKIQLVEGSSNWSECKDTDGTNTLSCNPGGMTPRRERSWMITRMNSETGKTCQEVFYASRDAEETACNLNTLNLNDTFKSYKNCSALKPCCDPSNDNHWNEEITYIQFSPVDSTDSTDTTNEDGEKYFDRTLEVPNNTKIRKITTYTRDASKCSDGDDRLVDIDERVNSNVDCVLGLLNEGVWGSCEGNCGNSIQQRTWSVITRPQGNGKKCSDVFYDHSDKSDDEIPVDGLHNIRDDGNFNTSKACSHDFPCCDWNSNIHWNEEENEEGEKNFYYRQYPYNAGNIPAVGTTMGFLSGSEVDYETFNTPVCNTKVVKFKKLIRNTDICMNGQDDHYEVVETKAGRSNCDCDLAEIPSEWNEASCSNMECKDNDTIYYKTRSWSILNQQEDTDAKTCEAVFNDKQTGEIYDSIDNDNNKLISKLPCNRPRCPIDCELSVSQTPVTECPTTCGTNEFSTHTWTIITEEQFGGSNCDSVFNRMKRSNETLKDIVTIPNSLSSTFESKIECSLSACCSESDYGDWVVSPSEWNGEESTVPCGTTYTKTRTLDTSSCVNNNSLSVTEERTYTNSSPCKAVLKSIEISYYSVTIEYSISGIDDQNNRKIISIIDDTTEEELASATFDDSQNRVTINNLSPGQEYTVKLRTSIGENNTDSDPMTFTTNRHCEIRSLGGWGDCDKPCGNGIQQRTWTIVSEEVGAGSNCSYAWDNLNDDEDKGDLPSGSSIPNSGKFTTQKSCKIGDCCDTYDDSHTDEAWGHAITLCGNGRLVRTLTLDQTGCINGNNLSVSIEKASHQQSACLPTCSVTDNSHWDETPTYYLHRPISATNGVRIDNYDPSNYQLGCNSKITKNTSYTLKSGSCVPGVTTRDPSNGITVNTDQTQCTTTPIFGNPTDITPTSFRIPIQDPGTYNTRAVTIPSYDGEVVSIDETSNPNGVIIARNLRPSTSYTVTLTNTGEDGTTASNNITQPTEAPQPCTMESNSVWSGCSNVCGGGGTQTRWWQITSLANGGDDCRTRWREITTREDDEDLVLPEQEIGWNVQGFRFQTQKSCLSSCVSPSLGDVVNCGRECSNEESITVRLIDIRMNSDGDKTVYAVKVKYKNTENGREYEIILDLDEITTTPSDSFDYELTGLEPGKTYKIWIEKHFTDGSTPAKSNEIERRMCAFNPIMARSDGCSSWSSTHGIYKCSANYPSHDYGVNGYTYYEIDKIHLDDGMVSNWINGNPGEGKEKELYNLITRKSNREDSTYDNFGTNRQCGKAYAREIVWIRDTRGAPTCLGAFEKKEYRAYIQGDCQLPVTAAYLGEYEDLELYTDSSNNTKARVKIPITDLGEPRSNGGLPDGWEWKLRVYNNNTRDSFFENLTNRDESSPDEIIEEDRVKKLNLTNLETNTSYEINLQKCPPNGVDGMDNPDDSNKCIISSITKIIDTPPPPAQIQIITSPQIVELVPVSQQEIDIIYENDNSFHNGQPGHISTLYYREPHIHDWTQMNKKSENYRNNLVDPPYYKQGLGAPYGTGKVYYRVYNLESNTPYIFKLEQAIPNYQTGNSQRATITKTQIECRNNGVGDGCYNYEYRLDPDSRTYSPVLSDTPNYRRHENHCCGTTYDNIEYLNRIERTIWTSSNHSFESYNQAEESKQRQPLVIPNLAVSSAM